MDCAVWRGSPELRTQEYGNTGDSGFLGTWSKFDTAGKRTNVRIWKKETCPRQTDWGGALPGPEAVFAGAWAVLKHRSGRWSDCPSRGSLGRTSWRCRTSGKLHALFLPYKPKMIPAKSLQNPQNHSNKRTYPGLWSETERKPSPSMVCGRASQ